MSKALKIVLIVFAVLVVLALICFVLGVLAFGGAFDALDPHEVATFDSPDGQYKLVMEQLGAPAWSFGPAKVRLIVRTADGKKLASVMSEVYNDGADAFPGNVTHIEWQSGSVVVTLGMMETPDKDVTITWKN